MKIFISNLGSQITDESLCATFAAHGKVGATILQTDSTKGKKNGIAFVEMPHNEEAAAAIAKMNGSIIDGQVIVVEAAALPSGVHSPE